jgi:hypothetical protein
MITSPNRSGIRENRPQTSGTHGLSSKIGDQAVVVDRTLCRTGLGVVLDREFHIDRVLRMAGRGCEQDRSFIRMVSGRPSVSEPPSLATRRDSDAAERKICWHDNSFLKSSWRRRCAATASPTLSPCRSGGCDGAHKEAYASVAGCQPPTPAVDDEFCLGARRPGPALSLARNAASRFVAGVRSRLRGSMKTSRCR